MGKKSDLCIGVNGLFLRNVGWKKTAGGKYVQQKFYLGHDRDKAEVASLRLEKLWVHATRRWERENQNELEPTDRPVWNATTLTIAEAVRKGESAARVDLPFPLTAMIPESPLIGDWLNKLQQEISLIRIELIDETIQIHSEEFPKREGVRLVDLGRRFPCQS